MTPSLKLTPQQLQAILSDVTLAASGAFVKGRGKAKARSRLADELKRANEACNATIMVPNLQDADALVAAFISAGGNWRDLVSAVSRNALDGSTKCRSK